MPPSERQAPMVRDVQARRRFEAQMLTLGPLAGELFEVCCLERFPDAWSATGGLSGGVARLKAGLRLLAEADGVGRSGWAGASEGDLRGSARA